MCFLDWNSTTGHCTSSWFWYQWIFSSQITLTLSFRVATQNLQILTLSFFSTIMEIYLFIFHEKHTNIYIYIYIIKYLLRLWWCDSGMWTLLGPSRPVVRMCTILWLESMGQKFCYKLFNKVNLLTKYLLFKFESENFRQSDSGCPRAPHGVERFEFFVPPLGGRPGTKTGLNWFDRRFLSFADIRYISKRPRDVRYLILNITYYINKFFRNHPLGQSKPGKFL